MKISQSKNAEKNNKCLTHEIIIGLVAGVGTDLDKVEQQLITNLCPSGYDIKVITVSELSKTLSTPKKNKYKIKDIHKRINRCNALRKILGRNDAMAILASAQIKLIRNLSIEKSIYIIRQLKNPEEVETLRKIYGKNFILISLYEYNEKRKEFLKQHDADNPNIDEEIKKLMERDEKEDNKSGQNTRGAFVEADYFIAMNELERSLKRFTEILCGYCYHTPTKNEHNMALAWISSLRSADLSRQVGAVIANEDGDILASGCNDIPKVGGGMFWEGDEPDYRDFKLGKEPNDAHKEKIIKEFIGKILKSTDPTKIANMYKKLKKEKSAIFNIIEYHRAVHGEEAAICDAARKGISTRDSILYCTTCPCHLCTKHIIASGIKKVVYIHPYPKSQTGELFNDLVVLNPREKNLNKVIFESFMGIAPRRMLKVFSYEPDTRKNKDNGKVKKWSLNGATSPFLSTRTPLAYYDKEIAYLNQLSTAARKKNKFNQIPEALRNIFNQATKEAKVWSNKQKKSPKQNWACQEVSNKKR
jgi:deoxycytidylate deaminase